MAAWCLPGVLSPGGWKQKSSLHWGQLPNCTQLSHKLSELSHKLVGPEINTVASTGHHFAIVLFQLSHKVVEAEVISARTDRTGKVLSIVLYLLLLLLLLLLSGLISLRFNQI